MKQEGRQAFARVFGMCMGWADVQNHLGGREAEGIPEGGVRCPHRSRKVRGPGSVCGLDGVGPRRHTGLGWNLPMSLTSCEPLSETWFPHPKTGMLTDPTAPGCRGI